MRSLLLVVPAVVFVGCSTPLSSDVTSTPTDGGAGADVTGDLTPTDIFVGDGTGPFDGGGDVALPHDSTVPPADGVEPPEEIAPDICQPDCAAKDCGGDGCGGSCGECGEFAECNVDGLCVAVSCTSSKDCPGDLVCYKELGFCVECAADEDCGEGQLCSPDFACFTPVVCDSDKDCKEVDGVCDKEAGICVDCLAHVDCVSEKHCFQKYCIDDICVGGTSGCDGNAVAVCNEEGSAWLDPVPCLATQYCEEAACFDQVCPPDQIYCDGNVLNTCDEIGKEVIEGIDCSGQDLICYAGECKDLVCTPLAHFCPDPVTKAVCAESGMDFQAVACGEGTFCDAGECVPWACQPGELTCNAAGTHFSECNEYGSGPLPDGVDCAAEGLCCVDGECVDPPDEICDGGDNNCNGDVDEGCDDDDDGWCDADMLFAGASSTCPSGWGDCDDEETTVNPGTAEVLGDGLDNDCDGFLDEIGQCPGQCTGHSVEAYLCALEMCFQPEVMEAAFVSPSGDNIDSAWEAVNHFGNAGNGLAPKAGNSYGLLACGPATGTSHSTDLPSGTATPDPFAKDGYSTYDNVELRLKLKAPDGALGFSVDYIFMSVEYEEYIGTTFNDKFYIFLTAPESTLEEKTVINYAACSNPDAYYDVIDGVTGEKYCYIAINTAYSEPCSDVSTDISGTGFECGAPDSKHGSSTGWLTTRWGIESGEEFELVFHIHDASDGIYDSEVVLDNFQWLFLPFQPGTTPWQ